MARDIDSFLIDRLIALEGKAAVSYPHGSVDFPKIERVIQNVPRKTWQQDYGTADTENPDCVLVEQRKVAEDHIYAKVYRSYEKIPGPVITSQPQTNEDGSLTTISRQKKLLSAINEGETIVAGIWKKITSEPVEGNLLHGYEVIASRAVPALAVPFTRYDDNLGPVQGYRKLVIYSNQVASLTATAKKTYEGQGDSILVAWEVSETNSNGTGTAGNPAYPVVPASLWDEERGSYSQSKQLTPIAGTSSLVVTAGVATRIRYEQFNEFLWQKVTETFAVPGPVRSGQETGEYGVEATTKSLVTTGTLADFGVTIKSSSVTPIDIGLSIKETVTYPTFPILYDFDIDRETGASIVSSYQVVDAASAGTGSISDGIVTTYRHIDKWRSLKTIVNYSAMTGISYDEQRFAGFSVPALLDYTKYFWTTECGAFINYGSPAAGVTVPIFRASDSFMVQMRTTITFTTTKQTYAGLLLRGQSLILGRAQLPNSILIDAGAFYYYGRCFGIAWFPGSTPTYTQYLALIGTEQLVSGESVRLPSGLYRNTTLYVTMP
jgi:hypothetical protein